MKSPLLTKANGQFCLFHTINTSYSNGIKEPLNPTEEVLSPDLTRPQIISFPSHGNPVSYSI